MKKPPHIVLWGQKITRLKFNQTFEKVKHAVDSNHKTLLFAMNVHNLLVAHQFPQFKQESHQKVEIFFADGIPLVWLSRLQGVALPERVSGTDLVGKIFASDLKIFLIGDEKVNFSFLSHQYLNIVGWSVPPYGNEWTMAVDKRLVKKINQSKAQVILVGVGVPRQEKWLLSYFGKTTAFVGIGVGSALEILSGVKPRAPKIIKNNGLEWLWRLGLEPTRLMKRYIEDVFGLARVIVKTFFKQKL